MFNASFDPEAGTVGEDAVTAIDARDAEPLGELIPGGLTVEVETAVLAVFADRFRDGAIAEQRRRVQEQVGADAPAAIWKGVDLADAAPEELEKTLSDVVLNEFKVRLERLGLEYQAP